MPSDIAAGRAFVELFLKTEKLATGLVAARRSLFDFARSFASAMNPGNLFSRIASAMNPGNLFSRIGDGITSLGKRLAVLGTAPLTALVPTIKAASDAAETLSKYRAVFGDQAGATGAWIDALSDRVGRSVTTIRDSISAYQAFFVGLGFGSDEAARMSREMQALTIDLGSFFNKSDEEAAQRFLSALSGSSEVLDQFGINIKQTALEAELGAMGIRKAWVDVSESEKVLARVSIIRRSMSSQGAIGDAARTADSLANQWKRLKGNLLDLSAAVGGALAPALAPIAGQLSGLLGRFKQWAQANPVIISNLASLAVKTTAAGAGLYALGKATEAGGAMLGLAWTISKVSAMVFVIGPLLFKAASALHLFSFAWAGLRMALAMVGPFLLKVGLMTGGLILSISALAAVFANAKLQGIGMGESVLDLAQKLTGLDNAYSRLNATMSRQRELSDRFQRLADAAGVAPKPLPAAPMAEQTPYEREREELLKKRRELEMKLATRKPPGFFESMIPYSGASAKTEVESLKKDLALIDAQLASVAARRVTKVGTGLANAIYGGLVAPAQSVGQQIGRGLWAGINAAAAKEREARRLFGGDLRRAQAGGMTDPYEREIAMARIDHDRRVAEARTQKARTFDEWAATSGVNLAGATPEQREAARARYEKEEPGLPTGLLDAALEQEIANIRARQAAEKKIADLELQKIVAEGTLTGEALHKARTAIEKELATAEAQARGTSPEDALRRREAEQAVKGKSVDEQNAAELRRANIEATMTGKARERALLEEERAQAIKRAQESGGDVGLVNRLFDARAKKIDQSDKPGTVGGFGASLALLGPNSPIRSLADASKAAGKAMGGLAQVAAAAGMALAAFGGPAGAAAALGTIGESPAGLTPGGRSGATQASLRAAQTAARQFRQRYRGVPRDHAITLDAMREAAGQAEANKAASQQNTGGKTSALSPNSAMEWMTRIERHLTTIADRIGLQFS